MGFILFAFTGSGPGFRVVVAPLKRLEVTPLLVEPCDCPQFTFSRVFNRRVMPWSSSCELYFQRLHCRPHPAAFPMKQALRIRRTKFLVQQLDRSKKGLKSIVGSSKTILWWLSRKLFVSFPTLPSRLPYARLSPGGVVLSGG